MKLRSMVALSLALVSLCLVACACPSYCWNGVGLGEKNVGSQICISGPDERPGETWTYQFMILDNGVWRLPTTAEQVTYKKVCVTPTTTNCGKEMAVRLTVTQVTGGSYTNCILQLCNYWRVKCPQCPTMTPWCEGEATSSNLPQGETSGFTYTYAIGSETPPGTAMTLARLNALTPGTYTIGVYTTATGTTKICDITVTVVAKPTGTLTVSAT